MKRRRNPELLIINPRGKPRYNPELLIINPSRSDSQAVRAANWRKLRKSYGMTKAIREYAKFYPDDKIKVKRNGGQGIDLSDPEYKRMAARFRKFHGRSPDAGDIIDITDMVPGLVRSGRNTYVMALGEAPAESYDANGVIESSNKEGSVYVHPYEAGDGRRPMKVLVVGPKGEEYIVTLPVRADGKRSKHKVSDWIRG